MPRYHRVEDIIQLALALQVPGPGLCLEDIQQRFAVGRRTAERMREAVDRLYPGITSMKGRDGRKYWRLSPGQADALVTWLPEELDALAPAILEAESRGELENARILSSLRDKLETLTSADDDASEPTPTGSVPSLRRGIVLSREVTLHRRRADGEPVPGRVRPYGLLGAARLLLVAVDPGRRRPRLIPVEDIGEVELLEATFEHDPNVDLRRYAANAFIPFEEGPIEVCWRLAPEAIDDALGYEFHAEQRIEIRTDGSAEVRFPASGLVEMAWHLFAWGDRIEARDLPVLKHRFNTMTERALEERLSCPAGPPVGTPMID